MAEKSAQDEIVGVRKTRPHLVLLGAGASRAAFPNGEKFGKKLPLMKDFGEIVPVGEIFASAGIDLKNRNFEEVYSELSSDPTKTEARNAIERRIFEYFSSLELPNGPTLYDYLLLSLRAKDVIATFNWDPFLVQAVRRNLYLTKRAPNLLFLHGNVLQGYCERDDVHGVIGFNCSRCGDPFEPVPLLYPVNEKEYDKQTAIRAVWKRVRWAFENAFMVTAFGYSAPSADRGAVELLREAWGGWQKRSLEQFEFIDVRDEEALVQSWKGFVDPRQAHFEVHSDFYDSWIANHPRRSIEASWNQNIEAQFIDNNPVPRGASSLPELWDWFKPLLAAEAELDE